MDDRTISEQLEEIKNNICDDYCRFPREIGEEETLIKKCEECPLNYL